MSRKCNDFVYNTHRQAITVRYHGPTNHRGSRYVATCEAKPRGLSVPYDHALSIDQNQEAAARALIVAMGWDELNPQHGPCVWVGGGGPDGSVVFVAVPSDLADGPMVARCAGAPLPGDYVRVCWGGQTAGHKYQAHSVCVDQGEIRVFAHRCNLAPGESDRGQWFHWGPGKRVDSSLPYTIGHWEGP